MRTCAIIHPLHVELETAHLLEELGPQDTPPESPSPLTAFNSRITALTEYLSISNVSISNS